MRRMNFRTLFLRGKRTSMKSLFPLNRVIVLEDDIVLLSTLKKEKTRTPLLITSLVRISLTLSSTFNVLDRFFLFFFSNDELGSDKTEKRLRGRLEGGQFRGMVGLEKIFHDKYSNRSVKHLCIFE